MVWKKDSDSDDEKKKKPIDKPIPKKIDASALLAAQQMQQAQMQAAERPAPKKIDPAAREAAEKLAAMMRAPRPTTVNPTEMLRGSKPLAGLEEEKEDGESEEEYDNFFELQNAAQFKKPKVTLVVRHESKKFDATKFDF